MKLKRFRVILQAIKNIAVLLIRSLEIRLSHFKGYQDDAKINKNLTRWVQLNIIADHVAKSRLVEFLAQDNKVKFSSFHGEGWSCWLGKNKCKDFTRQKLHE